MMACDGAGDVLAKFVARRVAHLVVVEGLAAVARRVSSIGGRACTGSVGGQVIAAMLR